MLHNRVRILQMVPVFSKKIKRILEVESCTMLAHSWQSFLAAEGVLSILYKVSKIIGFISEFLYLFPHNRKSF